jgi:ethanolamine utilization protein EutQ (cupin superfamily)
MGTITMTTPETRQFTTTGDASGSFKIARDVGTELSQTLGAGLVVMENYALEWTLLYDEYLYCVEGTMTLKTKEGDFVMTPGCGIWLPSGTWLVYQAKEKATVVFTVYPVNWRELHGKA